MHRRSLLRIAVAAVCPTAVTTVFAHTPYNQWNIYRRKHLLIGSHKEDRQSYLLAQEIVEVLDDHLPAASARVARAPNPQRIASLMATDQMDTAVIGISIANSLAEGTEQFAPYGPIALRLLISMPEHVLVCREDMPTRHAWLIADALSEQYSTAQHQGPILPWHPGAQLRLDRQPLPEV